MKKKKWFLGIIYILILAFVIFYLPFYGFSFPPCTVREKSDPKASQFVNKTFTFTSNVGTENLGQEYPSYCQKYSSEVPDFIFGASGSEIAKGETYTIQTSYFHRVYGINGIDSGTDWNREFIIMDSAGHKYRIWCGEVQVESTLKNIDCDI